MCLALRNTVILLPVSRLTSPLRRKLCVCNPLIDLFLGTMLTNNPRCGCSHTPEMLIHGGCANLQRTLLSTQLHYRDAQWWTWNAPTGLTAQTPEEESSQLLAVLQDKHRIPSSLCSVHQSHQPDTAELVLWECFTLSTCTVLPLSRKSEWNLRGKKTKGSICY